MKYINETIKTFLKDLGSKTPAPGGGAVAALSSAMAASLIVMVSRFSVGKEKYKKQEVLLKQILLESEQLEKRLSDLVDEDIAAYRSGDLERAIDVPAQVCFLSYDLVVLAARIVQYGNKNLISDAKMALLLADASFNSGIFYIEANFKRLKVKSKRHSKLLMRLESLRKKVLVLRKKVEV